AVGATNFVAAEGDRILQEPESLLRVAAVVEAIRAEVDDVARRAGSARTVGTRRQRIAGGVGVLQVVFVRQAARSVLPRPLVDVDRVLRTAAGEDAGVAICLLYPCRCRCASGRDTDAAFRGRLCRGEAEA